MSHWDARRSGRTTRMLREAKRCAKEGRAVYVIADNLMDARRLCIEGGDEAEKLGIKFETPESVGNLIWDEMRLRGAHPNCVVLVDHYAIASRFGTILEMFHRFDA